MSPDILSMHLVDIASKGGVFSPPLERQRVDCMKVVEAAVVRSRANFHLAKST